MRNKARKVKKKMSGKITPRTALQASIINMCRQPIYRRIYIAWVVYSAKHATPNSVGSFSAISFATAVAAALGYAVYFTIKHHHLFG